MAEALKALICGSVRAADSGEAQCARCGAAIYPTSGSLAHARAHAIEMICIACASAMPDFTFGGFVLDHGRAVPISNKLAAQMLGMMEQQVHRQRQRQEKSKEQKGKQDDRDSKNR